ncbi:MAG: HAMP domain-containing histidine kinase, partial [Rhodothermales bacterium]|nr:HAMP domain-containing histidine kinase [Rhodothermales bacterium]
ALAADRASVDWFVLQDDARVLLSHGLAAAGSAELGLNGDGPSDGLPLAPRPLPPLPEDGVPHILSLYPADGFASGPASDPSRPQASLGVFGDISLASSRFTLIAGTWITDDFWAGLAPDPAMAAGLVVDGVLMAGTSVSGLSRDLEVIWLDDDRARPASLRIAHSLGDLSALLASMDRWFGGVFLTMLFAGLAGAWFAAGRVSRPLEQLTEATASVELDRASPRFLATRRDEIGRLSRTMESMVRRLRAWAAQVRAAERKAALGDFARQANHDVKNGLTPISNVVTHLNEVSSDPEELARVFAERHGSLQSGIAYLRELSTAYARISFRSEPRHVDVVGAVREITRDLSAADSRIHFQSPLGKGGATVLADPVGLRRIVENLVSNAQDSLPEGSGRIDVSVDGDGRKGDGRKGDASNSTVTISVRDDGPGIPDEVQERLFEDFFTTREQGAGLGLSIVRRLVLDLNGSVRVASAPGQGAEFIVELPIVPNR